MVEINVGVCQFILNFTLKCPDTRQEYSVNFQDDNLAKPETPVNGTSLTEATDKNGLCLLKGRH